MKTITLCAMAGLAASAAGQSVTLHFDLDGDPFNTAEVRAEVVVGAEPVTWTVWASISAPDPTAMFGEYVGSFVPEDDVGGTIINVNTLLGGQATIPTIDGLRIENINIFNWSPYGGSYPENPLAIFSFDFLAESTSSDQSRLSYDADGIMSVFPDDNIFSIPIDLEDFAVVSDVLIVPGACTASVLACGLIASRRGR